MLSWGCISSAQQAGCQAHGGWGCRSPRYPKRGSAASATCSLPSSLLSCGHFRCLDAGDRVACPFHGKGTREQVTPGDFLSQVHVLQVSRLSRKATCAADRAIGFLAGTTLSSLSADSASKPSSAADNIFQTCKRSLQYSYGLVK